MAGSPTAGFAAGPPPEDCAYKWVGTWTVYNTFGKSWTLTVRPDGSATNDCFMCGEQPWTCRGDTYIVFTPNYAEAHLSADWTRSTWAFGHSVRNGPPPARRTEQAAVLPLQPAPPPSDQGSGSAHREPSSVCPEGFHWAGGYLCTAYNADAGWCAGKGGRFVDPKIVGAPTRCEVDSQVANAAPTRPGQTTQGGGTSPGRPAAAGVPGGGIAPVPSQRPTQRRMGAGPTSAPGGHCVDYFNTMKKDFWKLALQCANQAEALTNMIDFFNIHGVQEGFSPDVIKRSAGNTIYPLVRDNDPGWFRSGDSTLPNCSQPLRVERQSQSFTECLRVYACAYAAASCGEETGPKVPDTPCSAISAQCLARNPIPQ